MDGDGRRCGLLPGGLLGLVLGQCRHLKQLPAQEKELNAELYCLPCPSAAPILSRKARAASVLWPKPNAGGLSFQCATF